MKKQQLYGIWMKDRGTWLCEDYDVEGLGGVIAFRSIASAKKRAACMYGYDKYSDAHNDDWCEVRELS